MIYTILSCLVLFFTSVSAADCLLVPKFGIRVSESNNLIVQTNFMASGARIVIGNAASWGNLERQNEVWINAYYDGISGKDDAMMQIKSDLNVLNPEVGVVYSRQIKDGRWIEAQVIVSNNDSAFSIYRFTAEGMPRNNDENNRILALITLPLKYSWPK